MNSDIVHPFYPQDVVLSGGTYIANDWDVTSLIVTFAGLWALVLGPTLAVVRKSNPGLKVLDQGLILWFVLSGSIHMFFEGYFLYNHARMVTMQDFFGQLWKEYSKSDSRYMSSDPFLLVIEAWTFILWGPINFLTAVLVTKNSPYRFPMQALVSTGEFYGNVLYLCTSLVDEHFTGKRFYRPEPYFFWFYFIFMNAIWLVVPGYCLYASIEASAKAFKISNRFDRDGACETRKRQ